MTPEGSISRLIVTLKEGDSDAAQDVWQRYYERLVALARKKLLGSRRRVADEHDVVQDAFNSFFQGVAGGRFPRLDDRDDLWRLLVVITARKAIDQVQRERAARRGGGTVRGGSAIYSGGADSDDALAQIVGDEPTPDFAAQVAEELERKLAVLADEKLERVAVLKMQGHTNDEIAGLLQVSLRTVARKLDAIRTLWQEDAAR